jgi:hypothetical protein
LESYREKLLAKQLRGLSREALRLLPNLDLRARKLLTKSMGQTSSTPLSVRKRRRNNRKKARELSPRNRKVLSSQRKRKTATSD